MYSSYIGLRAHNRSCEQNKAGAFDTDECWDCLVKKWICGWKLPCHVCEALCAPANRYGYEQPQTSLCVELR